MSSESARVIRVGLLGFGSVGQALARLLLAERAWLRKDRGVHLLVTGLATGRFGALVDDDGVDLAQALLRAREHQVHGPHLAAEAFAATCLADVIVETLPLEPFTGATATEATRSAFRHGRSVVSANKGPVAHALGELSRLAAECGVSYRFESAVADGMPVFNLIGQAMPAADVTGFTGLLNSTSNVVLDAVAAGGTATEAVAAATAMGITEVDPSYDLDGWDASVKMAALSAAVWGVPLDLDLVQREPVDEAAGARAVAARAEGRRLVSIAELTKTDGRAAAAQVRLVDVAPGDPFFALAGTSLGLQIRSRLLCPITISSDRPTVDDTAYGLLADLLPAAPQ
jgi:homoserine dehydrogenase